MPSVPDDAYQEPVSPSVNILTPTTEYINETCKFDFSHLPTGTTYTQVNNKNLNMAFIGSTVMRMKPIMDPFGWPAHWGYSPNVENEVPEVLFSSNSEIVLLVLSKPVTEFGFEIAPNQQNTDFIFSASVGNYRYDDSKGHPSVTVKTPSGAKLLAVKSTKPFTVLTINQVRTSSADPHAGGFAMANIRYKLAK